MTATEALLEAARAKMLERGVTLQELADHLGVSVARVHYILSGKRPHVVASDLNAIAKLSGKALHVGAEPGLIQYLEADSRLIPERLQQILQYLELDITLHDEPE